MPEKKFLNDIKVKVEPAESNRTLKKTTTKLTSEIKIGKSILELLTTAMYASPLTIYREYIQNAVDSIEEAEKAGKYSSSVEPRIDLDIDRQSRQVTILDTGTGIKSSKFEKILTSFGDSPKRRKKARGFRGIGRLAGLAYCKELIFQSKVADELYINELRWDCMKLRQLLVDSNDDMSLNDIVQNITELSTIEYDSTQPNEFFKVVLNGIQPIRNDILLNSEMIEKYISEVSPVPFKNSFTYGNEIKTWLSDANYSDYKIYLNGSDQHITRPYTNVFSLSKTKNDEIVRMDKIEIIDNQKNLLAKGFILHHNYMGAINDKALSGVKVRSGNIQVGENDLFRSLFKQERFNSWCIGEFHIIHNKIKPNGRRDGFEHNKFYYTFLDHLKPTLTEISKIIEDTSRERNLKDKKQNVVKFSSKKDKAIEKIESILKKNSVDSEVIKMIRSCIEKEI